MSEIRDKYTLDASQYINSMQRVIQATKSQADMAKEASYQATMHAKRTADAAREASRVQKAAAREAAEAEKLASKDSTDAARQAAEAARQRAEQAKREYEQQARAAQKAREAELRAKEAAHEATRAEREATAAAKEQAQAQRDSANASEALAAKVKGLVASYVSLQSVAKLVQLSDQYSSINAKLGMMEDRLDNTKAMQDAIMASAKRSRALYTDTADLITRLGTMASDAFGSFDELVAFSEQVNKNLVLSGASAAGASAATQQLAQALASGTLRGDELVSVMEQGPMIAQRIADYLDIDKGKIRELASEGAITAEIVKNAMLKTAEETNVAFESMPMTWSQVWTQVSNTFIEYSQPLLEVISFLAQHFDALIPIIAGVAGALLAYVAIQQAVALYTTLSAIATQGLWVTIAANPIGLIAAAIGVVIALIVKWIQSVGGLQVAWLTFCNSALNAGYAVVDGFRKAGELVATIVGGAAVAVAHAVDFLVNAAIDKINNLIDKANVVLALINRVADTSFHIEHLSNVGIGEAADNAFGDMTNAFIEANETAERNHKRNESLRKFHIRKAQEEANAGAGGSGGAGSYEDLYGYLSKGIPSGQSLLGAGGNGKSKSGGSGKGSSGGSGTLGKIASDTSDIKKSVEMSNEEISMLVDMATQRYVNNVNLEARAPVIQISGQNTGDSEADAKAIADKLRDILLEQVSSGSYLSYSII